MAETSMGNGPCPDCGGPVDRVTGIVCRVTGDFYDIRTLPAPPDSGDESSPSPNPVENEPHTYAQLVVDNLQAMVDGEPEPKGHDRLRYALSRAKQVSDYLNARTPEPDGLAGVPTKSALRYWVDSYERRRAIGETIVDYLHSRLMERAEGLARLRAGASELEEPDGWLVEHERFGHTARDTFSGAEVLARSDGYTGRVRAFWDVRKLGEYVTVRAPSGEREHDDG